MSVKTRIESIVFHMVAPLGSTNLSIKLITNEIRALISPSVVRSLIKWGISDMIPALGPFRRNKFPLKHEETLTYQSGTYVARKRRRIRLFFDK